MLRKQRDKIANRNLQMMMARATRGRGPIDGRAFFERLWQGNIFLDRQKVFRRSRKRKLHTVNSKKRIQETQSNQHCCCCQRIQLHLLASRQSSLRSVISVKETHQVAEAQQEKNAKLRKAFGISEFFIEGSSLDRERHAREAEARAAASQIYELVPSPSNDPVSGATPVVMEKKITHKRSGSSSKKKKGKKHKKDRSESPKISKKKDKSKKKKKEKEKKHKKAEVTSSESNSSDDSDNSSSSEAESKKKKKKKKKKSRNDNEKDKSEKKKAATKRKRQYSESSSNFPSEKVKKTSTQAKHLDKTNIDTTSRESRETYSLKLKQVRSHVKEPSPIKSKESSAKQNVFDIKGKSQYEEQIPQYTTAPQAPPKQNVRRSISRNRDDRCRSPRRYSKSRRPLPSPRRKRISKSPRRGSRYTVSRSRSRSRCNRYRGGSRRRHSPLRRNRSSSRKRSPKRSRNYSARSRNRRHSRSKTRSRSRRSSLSYSPVRRNPDRYRDLLDDKKQYRKSEVTKPKSRSVSRSKKTPIIPPRVSLRSSSEEETEILDDYPKQQEDEVRQNEINTLKRLQSGLAAKARETLGKKIICPIKMKTEKKDECILDIALPAELPKTTIINNQSIKLQENPEPKSPTDLNPLKSVESSRSPSPALPLTREEAMYPSSVIPAKIVASPIETATSEEHPIKLRSPMESPPFFHNELNNSPSRSRSPSPATIRKKNSVNKNTIYSRSASRSYSRSVSQEMTQLRLSKHQDSSKDKTSGCRSQDEKSQSPMLLSRSPSRTKESLRSENSRSSKSSSQSKCTISRSRSRSKRPNSCSPNKLRSRSSTRSVSQSHSPSKKSYTHSRSASRTSRDNQKRSPSRSSSNSSRSRGSFSSSSRSSTSGSSRSSRSTSSSSESNRSRSPSIPRRHGSPSFLDRRRITSARKRPIPYHRPTPSLSSSPSSSESSRQSDWSNITRQSSHSLTRSPSYNH